MWYMTIHIHTCLYISMRFAESNNKHCTFQDPSGQSAGAMEERLKGRCCWHHAVSWRRMKTSAMGASLKVYIAISGTGHNPPNCWPTLSEREADIVLAHEEVFGPFSWMMSCGKQAREPWFVLSCIEYVLNIYYYCVRVVLCLYWYVLIRTQALRLPNQHGAWLIWSLIILVQKSFTIW